MTTVLRAALDYIARGWNPTPVEPRDKKPVLLNWQTTGVNAGNAAGYFSQSDLNIGIVLGELSHGLTDIDLDCDEACAVASWFLPSTDALFGRQSRLDSHWLFNSDLCLDATITVAAINFDDPLIKGGGARLVELRIGGNAGAQTVFPPSIHKDTGEPIAWSNGNDPRPPTVAGAELTARVRKLAAAALLARYWPQQKGTGGHNAARLLGGLLRRAGWSEADLVVFVEAIARAAGDPGIKDRLRSARDAAHAFDAGKRTQGIPTLEKLFGKEIADAVVSWLDLKHTPVAGVAPAVMPKPKIRLSLDLNGNAAESEQAIYAAGLPVFRRDSLLVRPLVDDDTEGTRFGKLYPITLPYLRGLMGDSADFEKFDGRSKDYVAVKPPAEIAELILGRSGHWTFPTVNGLLMAPSMRADGSLIVKSGYDPATRLYLIDSLQLPPIPDHPTRDDALAALSLFEGLLADYAFTDAGESKSVALSALITPIVLPALRRVPLHGITSPDIGGGKSYLTRIAAVLATGMAPAAITLSKDEIEAEKRLAATLIGGTPIILIDNVSRVLKGDFLCMAIDQPRLKVRLLGYSKEIEIEPHVIAFATGNNLTIGGDLVRRTIMCHIDPGIENAWQRKFKINPVAMIRRDRGKYVAAALTLCRAFLLSGADRCEPLAGFEEWSGLVRSALVWLGSADPVKTTEALREGDPERDELAQVVENWQVVFAFGHEVMVLEIITRANRLLASTNGWEDPDFRSALLAVARDRSGDRIDAARLGNWLRTHQDKVIGGCVFRRGDRTKNGYRWRLDRG